MTDKALTGRSVWKMHQRRIVLRFEGCTTRCMYVYMHVCMHVWIYMCLWVYVCVDSKKSKRDKDGVVETAKNWGKMHCRKLFYCTKLEWKGWTRQSSVHPVHFVHLCSGVTNIQAQELVCLSIGVCKNDDYTIWAITSIRSLLDNMQEVIMKLKKKKKKTMPACTSSKKNTVHGPPKPCWIGKVGQKTDVEVQTGADPWPSGRRWTMSFGSFGKGVAEMADRAKEQGVGGPTITTATHYLPPLNEVAEVHQFVEYLICTSQCPCCFPMVPLSPISMSSVMSSAKFGCIPVHIAISGMINT